MQKDIYGLVSKPDRLGCPVSVHRALLILASAVPSW